MSGPAAGGESLAVPLKRYLTILELFVLSSDPESSFSIFLKTGRIRSLDKKRIVFDLIEVRQKR